jgi:peptidoglycan hydrolase CwlO-like protein
LEAAYRSLEAEKVDVENRLERVAQECGLAYKRISSLENDILNLQNEIKLMNEKVRDLEIMLSQRNSQI